ncbi:TRAP transporter substrate-binding protein [Desulfobacterales bacterium HSG2]|nr:TRAP transporter substrate-binding protein [Desulfobacterales bacterium HSG2]
MKRRDFMGKMGLGVATAGLAGPMMAGKVLAEEKPITWKLATSWPPQFPILQESTVRMAKNIETMTGGRLKMDVYAANELVGALEVFDAVSHGVIQSGSTAPYFYADKTPEAQFFSDYPFGMTNRGKLAWLYCGGGMELFREMYEPHNLYPFVMLTTGTQMGGWFRKEIRSLADLKGLKMRIPGIPGKVLKRAGVSVIHIPGRDVIISMKQGALDAAEWAAPAYDAALDLQGAANYYYYPGWHEPATTVAFIVNSDSWKALPDDLKMCVEMACSESTTWTLATADAQNGAVLKSLLEKYKIKLRKFPDDVLRELRRLTDEVMEEEASKNPKFRKVYDSLKKFQASFNEWMEASEWAYIDAVRKQSF